MYFNVVGILVTTAAYGATRYPPLLIFVVLTHVEALSQFLPFVRLDGYWVVSDLIGVPPSALGFIRTKLLERQANAVLPPIEIRSIYPYKSG